MATIEKRRAADGSITYRARVRRQGEPEVSKTFLRKTDAEAWARQLEPRADRGYALPTREALTRTVADAIDKWITDRLPAMAATDRGNAQTMALWWKGRIGKIVLVRADPELIGKAAKSLRDEQGDDGKPLRSPQRVSRYIATLSRVLGYAVKQRWLETNPCKAVERFAEPQGRTRWLTAKKMERCCRRSTRAASRNFLLFVRFALFTAARRGEIETLEWRDVDTPRTAA